MEKNYQKEYIDISSEFRTSNGAKDSVAKLYDLLYELEKINRTKNEELILSNIYTLLAFHQFAYEIYKPIADLSNRKDVAKLYTLEQKAKSHGNNFRIKDIRKLRGQKTSTNLAPEDFTIDAEHYNKFVTNKNILVFNKIVEHDKFEIYIYGNHKFDDYNTRIIDYISWLGNSKSDLITFYNLKLSEHTQETADEDWYDTLEVFNTRIIVGQNGKLFAEISVGDDFMSDHILDIEIEEKQITDMSYDG